MRSSQFELCREVQAKIKTWDINPLVLLIKIYCFNQEQVAPSNVQVANICTNAVYHTLTAADTKPYYLNNREGYYGYYLITLFADAHIFDYSPSDWYGSPQP